MGQTTPNIGIYIPAAGETNYDQSFAAGMVNIDQHDHSGGPNKGVPIGSSGIADGAITYNLLNANVADNATGIGTSGSLGANQLSMLGLLKNIYQIATLAGFISKDGSLAHARTLTGTANQIQITNGDGIAGDPVFGLSPTQLSTTQPAFSAYLSADVPNTTGNGTNYNLLCDVILKNQSGTPYDSSTGAFTAPVNGTYLLIGCVNIIDVDPGANDGYVSILTTTQRWRGSRFIPNPNVPDQNAYNISILVPMSAGDTARLQVTVNGMAGNTCTVKGATAGSPDEIRSYFAGYLLF